MNNKQSNNDIFEILNSDIHVQEIMAEIESSLSARAIDKTEIDRIARLKFSSDSPAGHREFDPSLTANLFEKGIAPPKFSNPKYWFVKGPIKWIIIKLTEFYSLVDKKLSENRIKAFYSVLHELILLKVKHQRLEQKVTELFTYVVELRTSHGSGVFQSKFYDNDKPFSEAFTQNNVRLQSLLRREKPTLVLLPDCGNFLNLLKINSIVFQAVVQNKDQYDYIAEQISSHVIKIESVEEFTEYKNYSNIVLHCNACLLPAWVLEKVILNVKLFADQETQFLIQFSNSTLSSFSPFQENLQTRVDKDKWHSYLKGLGFKNIHLHSVGKDEMELITFTLA